MEIADVILVTFFCFRWGFQKNFKQIVNYGVIDSITNPSSLQSKKSVHTSIVVRTESISDDSNKIDSVSGNENKNSQNIKGNDESNADEKLISRPPQSLSSPSKYNSDLETKPTKGINQITADYKNPQNIIKSSYVKPLESSYIANRPLEPMNRALDHFRWKKKTKFLKPDFDAFYDIVIIGGGVMGCSVAYWLAQRIYKGHKIAVIERDPTYRYASTTLSVGGLRQQFSLPENVEMSLFGADFLRSASRVLHIHGVDMPDINFQPHGYLFLASEDGVETMEENHNTQVQCGAKVELMTPRRLQRKFPWLNLDGIALGSYGYENEGWFDPWALMSALRLKAMQLGVHFIHGDVYNVAHETIDETEWTEETYTKEAEALDERRRLNNRSYEVHVHLPDGDIFPITSSQFVVAAGAQSGHVANMFGIGLGPGLLSIPLPVEPRKRYVYNFHAPTGPGLSTPLVIDPTGCYFRREGHGNNYIAGMSPPINEMEPSIDNMDVDYDYFDEQCWPILANRVKSFENLKVKGAWAGFYDYNTWDQNAILGNHPWHSNVWFATGFSGHGIQQAPAIGRAIAELIYDDDFATIDLTRFCFDRMINDVKMKEAAIV